MHWKAFALAFAAGLLVALVLRPAPAASSHAAEHDSGAPAAAPETSAPEPEPEPLPKTGLLIDLGNKVCPVMGGEVDGESYIEWENLRVGFCCAGCDARFLADPEDRLESTGADWRAARAAIEAWRQAPPEHKAHRLAEIRRRWQVIREPEE